MCVGYVPLLEVDLRKDYMVCDKAELPDKLPAFIKSVQSRTRAVEPIACSYCLYKGMYTPVLVYRGADQIAKHILSFSHQSPREWFELYANRKKNNCYIILWPRQEKIIQEFLKANNIVMNDDDEVHVVQRSLLFFSDNAKGFDRLDLSEETYLGIVDERILDKTYINRSAEPIFVGPFDIQNNIRKI